MRNLRAARLNGPESKRSLIIVSISGAMIYGVFGACVAAFVLKCIGYSPVRDLAILWGVIIGCAMLSVLLLSRRLRNWTMLFLALMLNGI